MASSKDTEPSSSERNVPISDLSQLRDEHTGSHQTSDGHGETFGQRFSFSPPPFGSHLSPWMSSGRPFSPRPFGPPPRMRGPSPPPPPPTPGRSGSPPPPPTPGPRAGPPPPLSPRPDLEHHRCPMYSQGGGLDDPFHSHFGRSRFDPRSDPRYDPRYDPRSDHRFMHGMYDFRGFGDHHDIWGFPPHHGRTFPPRPFWSPVTRPGPTPVPGHATPGLDNYHHHHCPYIQDWWSAAQSCPWIRHSFVDENMTKDTDFSVTINVSQFTPDDLNVTVTDGHLRIQGEHEERQEDGGFIKREFTRRYLLPDDVDPANVKSSLGEGGLLSVFASRKAVTSSGEDNDQDVRTEDTSKSQSVVAEELAD